MSGKILCQVCGAKVHIIKKHLADCHPEWDVARYMREYPDAPLFSSQAEELVRRRRAEMKTSAAEAIDDTVVAMPTRSRDTKQKMHELFGFGEVPGALNARGGSIMVTLKGSSSYDDMIPALDPNYVFELDLTKTVLMALELNMATYLWGYHGTGKTSSLRNICAVTRRPWVRVQHTINTEEAHIVGQMLARDGSTYFEPGPLTLAMKYGWVYCADEYDFAMPAVLSVYQPVLEGEPLYIKEAPAEWRHIEPHPDFRFVATGNTNGCGDETGLYQGTQLGNAANYSRFGVTEEVVYMTADIEAAIVTSQASINIKDANKIVDFANQVREAFKGGRVSSTISPRELINAGRIGLARGSNWRAGLKLAFMNRLSRVDKETIDQFAQRVFG
ncbi:AAA domain-containing protein [Roseospira marina]|uniref:AAA domain-containing protein n=1 Tax=Roseospira marina TaxID=140057 RepID=A0A5M6I8T5_9PROT|nr:AAA family ATPase [Roseospira marina]KAA5604347.1 AAA domain-containing protein [Roseospira marina]MBB4315469.1 cobaltochelatase CobS [Roseospira marina]MBB5088385.1 cobaltochelatase CobS [Roseospira marina]